MNSLPNEIWNKIYSYLGKHPLAKIFDERLHCRYCNILLEKTTWKYNDKSKSTVCSCGISICISEWGYSMGYSGYTGYNYAGNDYYGGKSGKYTTINCSNCQKTFRTNVYGHRKCPACSHESYNEFDLSKIHKGTN